MRPNVRFGWKAVINFGLEISEVWIFKPAESPAIGYQKDLPGNVNSTELVPIGIAYVGQVDRSHRRLTRTG